MKNPRPLLGVALNDDGLGGSPLAVDYDWRAVRYPDLGEIAHGAPIESRHFHGDAAAVVHPAEVRSGIYSPKRNAVRWESDPDRVSFLPLTVPWKIGDFVALDDAARAVLQHAGFDLDSDCWALGRSGAQWHVGVKRATPTEIIAQPVLDIVEFHRPLRHCETLVPPALFATGSADRRALEWAMETHFRTGRMRALSVLSGPWTAEDGWSSLPREALTLFVNLWGGAMAVQGRFELDSAGADKKRGTASAGVGDLTPVQKIAADLCSAHPGMGRLRIARMMLSRAETDNASAEAIGEEMMGQWRRAVAPAARKAIVGRLATKIRTVVERSSKGGV